MEKFFCEIKSGIEEIKKNQDTQTPHGREMKNECIFASMLSPQVMNVFSPATSTVHLFGGRLCLF